MTREELRKQIRDIGVIPCVRVESADIAMFAAENVLAGGIPIVEIASTVPDVDRVIRDLTRCFPKLIVGTEVGTPSGAPAVASLTIRDEASRHLDCGAVFLTGPCFDAETVAFCVERKIVVIPGALTPSEVLRCYRAGADFVKVFPCSDVGGERYIRALKRALPHVPLVPAGGITQSTASQFISAGAVALGIGEGLFPNQAVGARDGMWIRELASRFVNHVRQARAEMGVY